MASKPLKKSKNILFHQNGFLSFRDSSLAGIKGGFPESQLYSLYSHQAKCHQAFKCEFEAQKCYNRAISALDKSELDHGEKDAEKKLIQEALNSLNKDKTAKAKPPSDNKSEDVLGIKRNHSKYPSLSKHVKIQYSKNRGRFATASTKISPGTILGISFKTSSKYF